MNLAPFERLLKDAMGLDAASVGAAAVERAVEAGALIATAGDLEAYFDRLASGSDELAQLIEAVVVPETWFLRDRAAFSVLAAAAGVASRFATEPLKILSVPCATGEEPYSIAITLFEAGLSPDQFRIDACDLSPRLIARATNPIYGRNSFRGTDLGFRDRWFVREAEGYRLLPSVAGAVRFRQGNLLDPDWIAGAPVYDVVFCRNLLIYFDAATQERAVAILSRRLRPAGLLFVGSSETSLVLAGGFEPIKAPMAFAFRKPKPGEAAPAAPVARRPAGQAPSLRRASGSGRRAIVEKEGLRIGRSSRLSSVGLDSRTGDGGIDKSAIGDGLAEIRCLADAGHLAEAARLCQAHLSKAGPSADALALLGLVRDAAGIATDAVELYRKALYLDPCHEAALAHLALRLEKDGDDVGAKRLRERMRRLAARAAP